MTAAFLIDECLSPVLAAVAQERGYHAMHVRDLGLHGLKDHELMKPIISNDFVLVTNNRKDFIKLYQKEELHSGLVIIIPGGIDPSVQMGLFSLALDAISAMDSVINTVVEVFSDGSVQVASLPALRG